MVPCQSKINLNTGENWRGSGTRLARNALLKSFRIMQLTRSEPSSDSFGELTQPLNRWSRWWQRRFYGTVLIARQFTFLRQMWHQFQDGVDISRGDLVRELFRAGVCFRDLSSFPVFMDSDFFIYGLLYKRFEAFFALWTTLEIPGLPFAKTRADGRASVTHRAARSHLLRMPDFLVADSRPQIVASLCTFSTSPNGRPDSERTAVRPVNVCQRRTIVST
jgi:hypothetical protein